MDHRDFMVIIDAILAVLHGGTFQRCWLVQTPVADYPIFVMPRFCPGRPVLKGSDIWHRGFGQLLQRARILQIVARRICVTGLGDRGTLQHANLEAWRRCDVDEI